MIILYNIYNNKDKLISNINLDIKINNYLAPKYPISFLYIKRNINLNTFNIFNLIYRIIRF